MREQMEQHRANPVVRELPQGDGSARASRSRTSTRSARGARADAGDADRRVGAARRRHARGRRGDAAAGAAQAARACSSRTLTEKLLTYALGRGLDVSRHAGGSRDRPRRRRRSDYRFSAIVLGIVNSAPFQMRIKRDTRNDGTAAQRSRREVETVS